MEAVSSRFHSALEKISGFQAQKAPEISAVTGLQGEILSFQISGRFTEGYGEDYYASLVVTCPGCRITLFQVEEVPCTFPCGPEAEGAYLLQTPGLIPDALTPYEGKPLRMNSLISRVFWVDAELLEGEEHREILAVWKNSKGEILKESCLPLQVVPAVLPEQTIRHTEWFHCDCLCHKYGCEMFSQEFFEIAGRYIRCAVEHGVDTLLTPVFTPSLDILPGERRMPGQLVKIRREKEGYVFDFSLLEKWVNMAQRQGIRYFEIAPFFTQWGAKFAAEIYLDTPDGKETLFGWDTPALGEEYASFLKGFLPKLMEELQRLGIEKRTFFHISDEPSREDLENYRRAREMIVPYIKDCPVIDALSSFAFYEEGLVSVPVVAEDFLEPFLEAEERGPLWTYSCCSQDRWVPNFFLSMPSMRGRILGVLLYQEGIEGFLRWGYNFWNSQFSRESIDPYRVTDAGLGFPSGDGFFVYPGPEGRPVPSLRLKVLRDAFQDARALQALEERVGREAVKKLIKDHLGEISFTHYPVEEESFLAFRREVNKKFRNSSAQDFAFTAKSVKTCGGDIGSDLSP